MSRKTKRPRKPEIIEVVRKAEESEDSQPANEILIDLSSSIVVVRSTSASLPEISFIADRYLRRFSRLDARRRIDWRMYR
jgi:hypothetical protein